MKLRIILLTTVLTLTGGVTSTTPVRTDKTNNPETDVGLLFEKDGYKVYRFEDAGRYVYYVVPQGQAQTAYSESCGKTCVREVRTESTTVPIASTAPEIKR